MKKTLLLAATTFALLNLVPDVQASPKHKQHRTAQVSAMGRTTKARINMLHGPMLNDAEKTEAPKKFDANPNLQPAYDTGLLDRS